MAKKKVVVKVKPTKVVSVPVKTDVASVEAETIKRVGKTISTLEGFLSRWDASKIKPDSMFPQVVKIRKFYQALNSWQKDVTDKKNVDDETRTRRLRDFVFICKSYS
ncbi:Uncharacterised protein [Candidatus Bilamarchaeum dharawalense]|uniref:Uncharacterized protein n=1 Tax=Candidatus Bilamarchaeum dharawalense TaxID=2885759 RepID=A0A5E4LP97_9ARCH|nr:Uncharacterised protein [Candidatus Bilamarchaeum dharawalense]